MSLGTRQIIIRCIVYTQYDFYTAAFLIQMFSQFCLTFVCALSVPLCTGQSVRTYLVTPDVSTKCPGDPRYNLTTYVQNSSEYFQFYIFAGKCTIMIARVPLNLFQYLVDIQLRASDDCIFVPRTVSTFKFNDGFDPYASDDGINFYEPPFKLYVTAHLDCPLLI